MKKLLSGIIGLLFCSSALAQSDFGIVYGPYLQGVTSDEATVVWVTSGEAVSWVEIAPDDGSHFYAEQRPQFFDSKFGRKQIGTLHKVRIHGLENATSYRYRIYSREVVSQQPYFIGYGKTAASNVYSRKPYRFRTLDRTAVSARFAMVNDIHDNSELLEKLISQQDFSKLDFVLFNGDMVDNMHSEKQVFDGFLSRAVKMFASELPFFYARGNHETRGLFAGEYIDYFPTPTGQPYYSFRQGPVFFIMLDGGEDKPDSDIEYHGLADFDTYRAQQASWLRQTLQSEEYRDAPVRIAVLHVPPVESTWHGQIEVEKLFIPLLNEAGIDLMLSGHLHSHVYIPAGEQGCEFPVLVNSNKHVTNIEADTGGISIEIRDELGRLFKQIRVDK